MRNPIGKVAEGPREPGTELARATLALVMAGGNGNRLGDLTRFDSKPALPFGGHYRNIDFSLSNCVNAGIRRVAVLTQYKAHTLIQHVQQGWSFLRPELGDRMEIWPAQQRRGTNWYSGTADSVYQNLDLIERLAPERVLVLAGDHIYRMDYTPLLAAHVAAGLGSTVACIEVPIAAARGLGVLGTDARNRVLHFAEKPAQPRPLPKRDDTALASMGIYVFDRELLIDCLSVDASDPESKHDFGRDVLPLLLRSYGMAAYPFRDGAGNPGYWRDVGTLDAYWQANQDLLDDPPALDLHDARWPIYTHQPQAPPPRFVGTGGAQRSIVGAGSTIGGKLERCVVSRGCEVGAGTVLRGSLVLPDVRIGRDCRIQNAVIDAGCAIPDGTVIGEDAAADSFYSVSPLGVALVTQDALTRAARASHRLHVA
jgi:glucose-1-phosphate adenylyltransferase